MVPMEGEEYFREKQKLMKRYSIEEIRRVDYTLLDKLKLEQKSRFLESL